MHNIIQLLNDEFFLMYIPISKLLNDSEFYKLKYNYSNLFQNADAYKIYFDFSTANVQFYKEQLKDNKVLIIENKFGSFVFANIFTSDIFQILQKHYKDYTSYVFCASNDFGYFKILENGKIKRKIASYGFINGVTSYPETRGLPCEYEIENDIIYKIDSKDKLLKDMLKNFGRAEILGFIDYYIGLSNISNEPINKINIYEIK